MKKVKSLFAIVLVALVTLCAFTGCGVEKEYKYNTEIISIDNAPPAGDVKIENLTGFVEDTKQEFVEMPCAVGTTGLEIVAVGKYTGVYTDSGENKDEKDILALVVKNTSDKIISYSSFTVEYAKKSECTFNATNLPVNQSALVFTSTESLKYSDVTKFELKDSMAVPCDELPILDCVGVDYKDGEFIITNQSNDDLGDVYIRYKNVIDGNAYLGGITYSEEIPDLKAYETRKIPAENFSADTSVIIAVDNYKE